MRGRDALPRVRTLFRDGRQRDEKTSVETSLTRPSQAPLCVFPFSAVFCENGHLARVCAKQNTAEFRRTQRSAAVITMQPPPCGEAPSPKRIWQRNGGKGMKTKSLPVPIPLPPFLCPKFRCPTPLRPSAPRRSQPTSFIRRPSTLAPRCALFDAQVLLTSSPANLAHSLTCSTASPLPPRSTRDRKQRSHQAGLPSWNRCRCDRRRSIARRRRGNSRARSFPVRAGR